MKFQFSIILFCLHVATNANASVDVDIKINENSPPTQITKNQFKGKLEKSRGKREFFAFRGIPYGEIPARFLDAVPVTKSDNVNDINDALEFGPPCPQIAKYSQDTVVGKESCLYLNLYFPKDLPTEDPAPVLVFIDGTEFQQGGAQEFGPQYLMDSDLILVTINYRLGALGFLSTENNHASGNMGMKDIILALKWIQSEIQNFGGDPNKVTIFGHGSGGGAAVHFLILSTLATGLFHHAISLSGTALSPFALQKNPRENALKLGDKLNCQAQTVYNTRTLVECIRNKTVEEIVKAQYSTWDSGDVLRFTPSVDYHAQKPFLPSPPYDLISKGKFAHVPWIVGASDNEVSALAKEIFGNEKLLKKLNSEWKKVAPDFLEFRHTSSSDSSDLEKIAEQIWKKYFNESLEVTNEGLENILSDRLYWLGIKTAAFYHSKYSETFGCSLAPYVGGVLHFFQKSQKLGVGRFEAVDVNLSKSMVKLLVSFVKNGKPTEALSKDIEWNSISATPVAELAEPFKWYSVSRSPGFVSDASERLHFWHTLPLNEFELPLVKPSKDEF